MPHLARETNADQAYTLFADVRASSRAAIDSPPNSGCEQLAGLFKQLEGLMWAATSMNKTDVMQPMKAVTVKTLKKPIVPAKPLPAMQRPKT